MPVERTDQIKKHWWVGCINDSSFSLDVEERGIHFSGIEVEEESTRPAHRARNKPSFDQLSANLLTGPT